MIDNCIFTMVVDSYVNMYCFCNGVVHPENLNFHFLLQLFLLLWISYQY